MINLDKLRELIIKKKDTEKLSLREMANESGVSAATLSRFLNSEAFPETKTLSLLVDWLQFEMDDVAAQFPCRETSGFFLPKRAVV